MLFKLTEDCETFLILTCQITKAEAESKKIREKLAQMEQSAIERERHLEEQKLCQTMELEREQNSDKEKATREKAKVQPHQRQTIEYQKELLNQSEERACKLKIQFQDAREKVTNDHER